MTITKAQLISEIAEEEPNITKADIQLIVNRMINIVANDVSEGNKVELAKFGAFAPVKRAARKGRNPQTGDEIDIPEKFVPVFKPGKNFKESVNSKLTKAEKK